MPSNAARRTVEAGLDLDRFLPYRLSVLSNRVSDAIARIYSERFKLSIPEWRVMAVLGGTPGVSAREVAERTAMDKVQVSRAVETLVRARRVARTADADDGRIQRLALTPKGRAIYDDVVPLALHLEEVFLSALTNEERRQLDTLMQKLSRQAGRLAVSSV
jgi:DNA-binding MarR family transcriptional regulator